LSILKVSQIFFLRPMPRVFTCNVQKKYMANEQG
jgi:hypothetical protein